VVVLLAACIGEPSPSATRVAATPSAAATPSSTASVPGSSGATPTHSPEPSLSLDLPATSDPRVVTASVDVSLDGDDGELVVTVTSQAEERIDDLVLRWPTALEASLVLAPFEPSEDRIRDGGPPLVQQWTKWVVGPGEQGEPDGTISLGYGPLLPGATLTISLHAMRTTDAPLAFDLQVLAANDLLTLADGQPAELRVEVP
jgi:hypothetical protein